MRGRPKRRLYVLSVSYLAIFVIPRLISSLRLGAIFAMPGLLAACEPGVLNPRGSVGVAERTILVDSIVIMLAIVGPTIIATLGFAWWYRDSNQHARRRPHFAHSGRIELIVWAIPVLTITLLGGVAWIGSHELDPAVPLASDKGALDIQVVSLDWKWLFIYPAQQMATVNQLVIPAGVPIHFSLTSGSVMNAFFVPQLGSMLYTMNGMTSQLYLKAESVGVFRGLSAQYSGDGFSGMHFAVHAVPADKFSSWVETTKKSGPVLDTRSYVELAKQSTNLRPFTYCYADPGLFERIVTLKLPAGPGPAPDMQSPVSTVRVEH